jgi:N12 class adenine-specific DNA methylase
MKGEKRPIDEILVYVVSQKLNTITKGKRTEEFVKKFIEVMDAMETRSAFKELKASFKPTR